MAIKTVAKETDTQLLDFLGKEASCIFTPEKGDWEVIARNKLTGKGKTLRAAAKDAMRAYAGRQSK